MDIDQTTYNDLSVFHSEEEFSIFHKLNFTRTAEGKEWLLRFFKAPFSDARQIRETQNILKLIQAKMQQWPSSISNGTLMVLGKFYESGIDTLPSRADYMNAFSYKVFHGADFSLVRYSLTHFADFLRGIHQLCEIFESDDTPGPMKRLLQRARDITDRPFVREFLQRGFSGPLPNSQPSTEGPGVNRAETILPGNHTDASATNPGTDGHSSSIPDQRTTKLPDRFSAGDTLAGEAAKQFSITETIHYGRYFRYEFKNQTFELINIFGRLDAWYSMASAMDHYLLSFPNFNDQPQPFINAKGLYHILIPSAVPYDIDMNIESNFIFLTGANMAGKSTFIKSVGIAVFLAHLGMGVPAREMSMSVFDGLLSNINVVDNIVKGESYFFNEVQRIKNTIIKINDDKKWLVLIDELFKGTNVQDAMKCSSTVVKGLIKISRSLFILSTHLYEIGEELRQFPNISFKFFETMVQQDQLAFSYQLKDGISNDRIGYVILKREKVVEMLEKL